MQWLQREGKRRLAAAIPLQVNFTQLSPKTRNMEGHSREDWRRQDKPPIESQERLRKQPLFFVPRLQREAAPATAARILAITSA